jgi:hypothetical protein
MIQPEDISRKALAIYREYMRAWIEGEGGYFPRRIPAQTNPGADVVAAIDKVRRLREGSKDVLGYGYSVEWKEVQSRRHGKNFFPIKVFIATELDLLRLVGKEKEFRRFTDAVSRLRAEFPELDSWVRSNIAAVTEAAPDLDGLCEVLRYFRDHPRPNTFARELPLSVDSKFVERHERVLWQWLDLVLPPHEVRCDEDHFSRRFGLRYHEPDIFVRFLDSAVQADLGFPCDALAIPLHTIGAWDLRDITAVIVENRVNLMTLPKCTRAVAIGGLGNGASLLRYVYWFQHARVWYWGDLDREGIEILSRVRAIYPNTTSLFMDRETLDRYRHLTGQGSGRRTAGRPAHLTPAEADALEVCDQEGLRLEQERVPQSAVVDKFARCLDASMGAAAVLGLSPMSNRTDAGINTTS